MITHNISRGLIILIKSFLTIWLNTSENHLYMCNKEYRSYSFGHFVVVLIEHEIYLSVFFFVKPFLDLAGHKLIISMCFFFMINALITTPP
jgi:hypothetical protein